MLNEEEKEAIEIVKGLKTYYEAYYLLEDEEIKENEEKNEAIDTVLNLITKLERKIYDYDEIIARLEEKNVEKDKIIDEMAGYIAIIQDCSNENCGANLDYKNRRTNDNSMYEECWKRYFKEKVNKKR